MTVNDRPVDARLRLYLYISVVLVHVQRWRNACFAIFLCVHFSILNKINVLNLSNVL